MCIVQTIQADLTDIRLLNHSQSELGYRHEHVQPHMNSGDGPQIRPIRRDKCLLLLVPTPKPFFRTHCKSKAQVLNFVNEGFGMKQGMGDLSQIDRFSGTKAARKTRRSSFARSHIGHSRHKCPCPWNDIWPDGCYRPVCLAEAVS